MCLACTGGIGDSLLAELLSWVIIMVILQNVSCVQWMNWGFYFSRVGCPGELEWSYCKMCLACNGGIGDSILAELVVLGNYNGHTAKCVLRAMEELEILF